MKLDALASQTHFVDHILPIWLALPEEARGTLYSFTFVHIPLFGSTKIEYAEGYGVGQIDLPEGPRIQLPLVGKREEFRVGQPVVGEISVMREQEDQDVVLLRFRPVEACPWSKSRFSESE